MFCRFASFPVAVLAASLVLVGCGSDAEQTANGADTFAARIGDTQASPAPAPSGTIAPIIATPAPGAAPGPFSRGTLTDPASQICGAPKVAPFIGKLADQTVRAEVVKALGRTDNLRFVPVNAANNVNADPTNPRLSIMLDAQNIIRDARCG